MTIFLFVIMKWVTYMKKVALLYDFDKTLCDKDMQEYRLIPDLGYRDPVDFWKEVTALSQANQMDAISAYLYTLRVKFEEQGKPLREEYFKDIGTSIDFFPGVETWFERVNAYGREKGLEVEHYIISSGMKEIIENSSIASSFRKIYACKYYYDETGYAKWPAVIVNYTTKTQYIFRINKQVLDENNDNDLNTWVPTSQRPIPFTRMIYIADGITDVPCMRLVREYGGKSIVVYNPEKEKTIETAKRLIHEGRADFMSEANYEENSKTELLVKKILDHMSADAVLQDLEAENG